ncbi:Anoctamin [Fasciola gigantica]|uniref:Anoctamin n=1 Tax=Fasciola gigantica TaxID=46835 RepID=A0A504YWW1_FASGI|nr:Anoctamin [Fasciola gigantica]
MAAWLKEIRKEVDDTVSENIPWRSPLTSKNPDLYFRDGKRRIDYVLVYSKSDSKWTEIRLAFLRSLARLMVEIEVEDCFGKLLGATSTTEPERAIRKKLAPSTSALPPEPSTHALRQGLQKHDTTQGPPSSMDRYRIEALGSEDLFTSDDLVFVKLYAPWHTMGRYAELFRFRKPLIVSDDAMVEGYEHTPCCGCCRCCGTVSSQFPPLRTGYTWPFSTQREYLFDIPPDRDEFFSEVERALVLDYILRRAHCFWDEDEEEEAEAATAAETEGYKSASEDQMMPKYEHHEEGSGKIDLEGWRATRHNLNIGITKLVSDGVFLAAYPLHELSAKMQAVYDQLHAPPMDSPTEKKEVVSDVNNRIMLRRYWASYPSFARRQPLDYIRYYFGEAIAFYFAWLGFYTAWLAPVAVIGVLSFLMGLLGISSDGIIEFVCHTGANTTMCPLCSRQHCLYWNLGSSCLRQKLTHLVDNEGTVLFGVLMALWAIIFLEMWKRKQVSLAFRWNVCTLEPVDQPARPEFLALLLRGYDIKLNPVSGDVEPLVPFWRKRIPRFVLSYGVILFAVVLILACLVGVILYKLAIKIVLYQQANLFVQSTAGMITTLTGSVINLIFIFIMKMIYDRLAVKMTDLELHRTQIEYDNSLTLKLYLLQFVNYYSSVFYIAFIQGTTSALPGSDSMVVQSTGCDQGDCLFELFLQLTIIMVGKQLLNFCQEAIMPVLLRLFNRFKTKNRENRRRAAESILPRDDAKLKPDEQARKRLLACRADYNLLDPGSRPLFNEYLEMMIQYGFITMFVPAFPLAPFFGLLNNILEIRGDAKKFVCQYRRPVIERVKTIGE